MRLLLIRHGDPDYEHDSLTEKGVKEAELLADRLVGEPLTAIYVSPLGRAQRTAQATLSRLGREGKTCDWLREFSGTVKLPPAGEPHIFWDFLPSFLEEHPAPLLIDEAQYAPNLFSYIKIMVDKSDENGMYWLTGSQQFHLMKNVSESLAGRVGIVNLNSFMYAEIKKNNNKVSFNPLDLKKAEKINVNELFEVIFKGGMPALYKDDNIDRNIFFQGYLDTYISRDVRELTEIGNTMLFKKFIVSVASRTSEQLNYSELANDAGISVPTAQSCGSTSCRLDHLNTQTVPKV